jgi:hypothetical protein
MELTLSLSSKLEKLLVVRAIPRYVWSATVKAFAMTKNTVGSPQVQHVKSEAVSYTIKASRVSGRILKTAATNVSAVSKKGASTIQARGIEPAGKYLTITLPKDASRIGTMAKSDVSSFLREANYPAKAQRIKLAGMALPGKLSGGFSRISNRTQGLAVPLASSFQRRVSQIQFSKVTKISPKGSLPRLSFRSKAKTTSLAVARVEALPVQTIPVQILPLTPVQVETFPAVIVPTETIPVESIAKMPVAEVRYPVNTPVDVSQKLSKAINDFSKLPLWLTMPMLFASSFVLGAIISFLIK